MVSGLALTLFTILTSWPVPFASNTPGMGVGMSFGISNSISKSVHKNGSTMDKMNKETP